MASRTAATKIKRAQKEKNRGRKRRAKNNNKGTTPKFAVHEK